MFVFRLVRNCELYFSRTQTNLLEYNYDLQSVAVADFNSDTWMDFVVSNRAVNTISIFLGSGKGTFTKSKMYSTGPHSRPGTVAVGDFNQDQHIDIAVANFGTNTIGLFLGLGDGSFVKYADVSTNSSRPIWIHIVDLDDDTYLDMVTANYGHHSISILRGDGRGDFSHWLTYSMGYDSFPISVISGDFNNDHLVDLVIVNAGTNNIQVLFAEDNGTFSNQKTFSTGISSRPQSVDFGYLNKDNLLDIVVTNTASNNVGIFLNTGNGTFVRRIIDMPDSVSSPYSIAVGDIDNDEQADLIVTNQGAKYICIFLGRGNGTFSRAIKHRTGSFSSIFVILHDLNKDRLLDMILINNDLNSISISFGSYGSFQPGVTYRTANKTSPFLDTSNRDYSKAVSDAGHRDHKARTNRQSVELFCLEENTYILENGPSSIAFGDFNNDTHPDIVVSQLSYDYVAIFLGRGDGSFKDRTTYETGWPSQPVVVADLNKDSRLDIIVLHFARDSVGILLGHGNGSFANMTPYSTSTSAISLAVADFNSDTQLDIVILNTEKNIDILFGYGNGSFAKRVKRPLKIVGYLMVIDDFNGDTQTDIVVVDGGGRINVLLGYGNGSFANQIIYRTGTSIQQIAVGDLNNDNRLDIVVSAVYDYMNIGVLLGYGNGSFANLMTSVLDMSLSHMVLGDANNDDRMDLITIEWNEPDVKIFHDYRNGSFANYTRLSTRQRLKSIAVRHLNDDNQLDIVAFSLREASMILFISTATGFSTNEMSIASSDGSRLNSVLINDFNNDSISDIIVVNSGTNNIGVLLGHDNGSFEEQMTFSTGQNSNPYSITIGDFNEDDKLDLAVGNSGTNTIELLLGDGMGTFEKQIPNAYALRGAPIFIAADDFNHDGQLEAVVAYNNTDDIDVLVIYDVGSFTDLIAVSIGLHVSAPAFADLNNDARLDIVVVNFADNSISVFLGYGNGSFSNMTTYATINEPSSLAIADFNNDNQLDVVVSTSDGADIGILFGYGNGSFSKEITYTFVNFNIEPYDESTPDRFSDYEYVDISLRDCCVSLYIVDLNHDSYLDIVLTHPRGSSICFLFGYGNGSFFNQTIQPTNLDARYLVVGDFNNDTHPDIVVLDIYGNARIFLGYGNGSFAIETRYLTDDGLSSVAVGDFNNDHRLDIVVASYTSLYIGVFLGNGNGSFAERIIYPVNCHPQLMAVHDLNHDTNLDIVVTYAQSSTISVLIGYGNGSFTPLTVYTTGSSSFWINIADFNNDNQPDIAVAIPDDTRIGILCGDFQTVLKYQITLSTGNGSLPHSFVTADFNHDTHTDIIVVNSGTDTIGIFLGFGNGSFSRQMTYPTGSSPRSLAVGHFNNDTLLDIVLANHNNDTIGVFLGHGNGSFTNQTTYPTGEDSQPYSVAVADFDNDGHSDILVATRASSTILVFHGHGDGRFSDPKEFLLGYDSHPISLAIGDLNNDRKLDFTVINYGKDNLEIWLQTC